MKTNINNLQRIRANAARSLKAPPAPPVTFLTSTGEVFRVNALDAARLMDEMERLGELVLPRPQVE